MAHALWRIAATLGLAAAAAQCLAAGDWPAKPLTLVIPYPPGNTADLAARVIAPPLSRALGQPVVVDNRAGAGGNIAVQAVARSDKDGYTLLLTTGAPLVINPALYKNPGFDPERDLAPIAIVGTVPMVLVANKNFPASTMPQFVDHLRTNASKLSYASVGQGSFTHLGMELLLSSLGLNVAHIPYKGASPAQLDLQGGRVDFMFDSIASSNAQLKAGRVKAIAVTSRERSPFLMDAPTVIEGGDPKLKNFEVVVWTGLFAPAGTPAPVQQRLNQEIAKILRSPEIRAQLAGQYIRASDPLGIEQFSAMTRTDRARWTKVAKDIGLELQ